MPVEKLPFNNGTVSFKERQLPIGGIVVVVVVAFVVFAGLVVMIVEVVVLFVVRVTVATLAGCSIFRYHRRNIATKKIPITI